MRKFGCLILTLCFLFQACKKNQNTPATDQGDISNFLLEHVPPEISVADDIILRFKKDVPENIKSSIENYISIRPKINAKYTWQQSNQLVIEPSERLPYEEAYTLGFDPVSFFGIEAEPVLINFKTRVLKLGLDVGSIRFDFDGAKDISFVKGSIESNDIIDRAQIEPMLSAKQSGNKNLNIVWTGAASGKHFPFTIEGIEKQNKDSELVIAANGTKWDDLFKKEKRLEIQAKGQFKLTEVKPISQSQSYISVFFSDPLLKNQNLKGLITTEPTINQFKTEIKANEIRLYPESSLKNNITLVVSDKILNYRSETLLEKTKHDVQLSLDNPQLRLLSNGVVTPIDEEVIFPFEGKNLNAVDVEIFKIYENNVLQFLQYNTLDGQSGTHQVGKIIFQDSIPLDRMMSNTFERYYIDLKKLVDLDPAAIYQIRIGFRKHYALLNCDNDIQSATLNKDGIQSITEYYSSNYEGYEYKHRKDPCYPAFYNNSKFLSKNVLPSNIGIIAKSSSKNKLSLACTNLKTTQPMDGVELVAYNYQQQILAKTNTKRGVAELQLSEAPYFVIAKHNGTYGYLNLQDYYANPLTEFEVQGKSKHKSLDGFIYGERGVWRPGDTMHLSFMLEDLENTLPSNHPVTINIKDSRGAKKYTEKTSENKGGVYVFQVPTNQNDPTGNWSAVVSVGKRDFRKTLKVETIKPNRLKIALDVDPASNVDMTNSKSAPIKLNATWLHGAPANSLKAKVDVQFVHRPVSFKSYDDYVFNDLDKIVNTEVKTGFEGLLDENGSTTIKLVKPNPSGIAGKLRANVKTRVFEKSGNASEDNFSVNIDPFNAYTGIKVPKTRWGSSRYGLGSTQTFKAINVDQEGKPRANKKLSIGIYKSNNRWWYRNSARNRFSYNNGKHINALRTFELTTDNSGQISFDEKLKEPGSYFVRVCDNESGHCTGDFFSVRSYYDDESMDNEDKAQVNMLFLKKDKEAYLENETAKISIPSTPGTKILLSVEKQNEVIYQEWLDGTSDVTNYDLNLTSDMAPNVYVHVSMIQKHSQEQNDLPIRMYGVIPVKVKTAASELNPSITMVDKLEPDANYQVTVSEKDGKEMHYTLAVVDEGLLDITRFKTPKPWDHFYAKQSLLLRTWDNFDYILNGYGKDLKKILTVGGDGENEANAGAKKANRFKPVVSFIGPFTLKPGEQSTHDLTMPNYVGSVKVMLVARNGKAYGHDHKVVPVKKPLMILATAPRVVGPQERFKLPVNVFAMEPDIKNVDLKVEYSDIFTIEGDDTNVLKFDRIGDQISNFTLKVKDQVGIGKIRVFGKSGQHEIDQEIEIDIRNPNPYISDVVEHVIDPNEDWSSTIKKLGMEGTNEAIIEVSHFPSINADDRMDYLIRYPYGCLEQTTSSIFPQLYLADVIEMDKNRKDQIQYNIEQGIRRLKNYQNADGSLSYWPGSGRYADWAQSYALHFLVEAKKKGYYIPSSFLDEVTDHSAKYARTFDVDEVISNQYSRYSYYHKPSYRRSLLLCQAYRLYVLALYNNPELSAMNILLKETDMPRQANLLLAAAYALAGKDQIAKEIASKNPVVRGDEIDYSYSYGSRLRTNAVACLAYETVGLRDESGKLAFDIAKDLGSNRWYSTQSVAFSLLAVGKFLGQSERADLAFDINTTQQQNIQSQKPMFLYELNQTEIDNGKIDLRNNTSNVMYVRLITSGQPAVTKNESYDKSIKMAVRYTDEDGKSIDPEKIKQGTDFMAVVTISNQTSNYLTNMALSQVFPSGWEIRNTRMSNFSNLEGDNGYTYQDVRDDRVYTFFNIGGSSKTFKIRLNAAYVGDYFLPDVFCEAMYDHDVQSRKAGKKVSVISAN